MINILVTGTRNALHLGVVALERAADRLETDNTPLRILHVLNHTHRANGHVCAMVDLACYQAMLGHKVSVCSSGGDFDGLLRQYGVEHFKIEQRRRPIQLIKALLKFYLLIRRERPDIVHAHMVASALLVFPLLAMLKFRLVTTVHNEFERSATLMAVGQRVIGVSGSVSQSMTARGISANKMRTVLNGTVGTPRFEPEERSSQALKRPAVVFVGGLHPRKGVPDLIAAHATVLERIPEAHLYIVGSGPFYGQYAAQAKSCAPDKVIFCGHSDNPRSYLLSADIFVLPSHAEPAGLVLSEAREAGCAIIACDVGGIPEMVEQGQAGTLIPPKRPDLLAAALLSLLESPSRLSIARQNSQINLARLSLERVTSETVAGYRELLN